MLRLVLVLILTVLVSAPVRAQLAVSPESLAVEVPQRQTAARTVTVTNTGSETMRFCLSYERPLQRSGAGLRLSEDAAGEACGPLGEILYEVSDQSAMISWDPNGLAMTPDGRLFVADRLSDRTHELTPDLEILRSFAHPMVAELHPFPTTRGLAYNSNTATLWWMNVEPCSPPPPGCIARVLLLEGDLNGVATGRRIELPLMGGDPPEEISPSRLAYDPAQERYYFNGYNPQDQTTAIWAVDTLGNVVPGYPVQQMAYPGATAVSLDAYGGAHDEPEAVRLEVVASRPTDTTARLFVITPQGEDLGIVTIVPDLSMGTFFGSITGEPLRSRVDPNGVLYFPFVTFDTEGVVGIRPHPIPPSWLALSAWDGTLAPGASAEITLTFQPGERALGSYTAALQVFAASGEAAEVPLTLTVLEATATEPGPSPPDTPVLAVYPNPAGSRFTVETGAGAVVIYDVLGRAVRRALVAGGRAEVSAAGLAAGVYLVRASDGATARVTIRR